MKPEPRRQAEPPDREEDAGLWIHRRPVRGEVAVEPYLFWWTRGRLEDNSGYRPSYYGGYTGETWEGPFPVPSLPVSSETRA